MGKRQKIDVNNVFLPNALDDKQKQMVIKSAGWPLVVTVHSTTEQRLFVAGVVRGTSIDAHTIHMTNKAGVNVCAIQVSDEGRLLGMWQIDNPLGSHTANGFKFDAPTTHYSHLLKSDSIRYAMNVLRKNSVHRAKEDLIRALNSADRVVQDCVTDIIDDILRVCNNDEHPTPPTIRLDNNTQIDLLRSFQGDLSKESISLERKNNLDTAFQNWLKESSKYKNVFNQAIEFFNTDKWIVFAMNGGIVLGTMSRHTALAQLEGCRDNFEYHIDRYNINYLDLSLPYKWYKSVDDLPPETKQELEMSLVMLKAHLPQNANYNIEKDILPNNLSTPNRRDQVWLPVGSARNRSWHYTSPFYLISK